MQRGPQFVFLLHFVFGVQSQECVPLGIMFTDGFVEGNHLCNSTNNQCSYYVDHNFYFDINVVQMLHLISFYGSIYVKSRDWVQRETIIILKNSQVTFDSYFHSRTNFIFGPKSKLTLEAQSSFAGNVTIEEVPEFSKPPIIAWDCTKINLHENHPQRLRFNVKKNIDLNSDCFDVFSLNGILILNMSSQPQSEYYDETEFPLTMTEGTLHLLSNKRLLRFCPNGTSLNTTVSCELIKENYQTKYLRNGKENYPFEYPHCPCDDSFGTDCYLTTTLNEININGISVSNTNLVIDHNTSITNTGNFKSIKIENDVELEFIGSLKPTNQLITFNSLEGWQNI